MMRRDVRQYVRMHTGNWFDYPLTSYAAIHGMHICVFANCFLHLVRMHGIEMHVCITHMWSGACACFRVHSAHTYTDKHSSTYTDTIILGRMVVVGWLFIECNVDTQYLNFLLLHSIASAANIYTIVWYDVVFNWFDIMWCYYYIV